MLPEAVITQLANIKIDPDALAVAMLELPQAECPVTHHFGPGVYIRTVSFKAGDFLIGHDHKQPHTVMVLRGRALVLGDSPIEYVAPAIFTGGKKKKVVFCLEDCHWSNIFPNPDNERDIDTLEDRYLDKSDVSKQYDNILLGVQRSQVDSSDFMNALSDIGITEEEARAISDRDELTDMPDAYLWRLSVRESPIQGKGLFLSVAAEIGEQIAPATYGGIRTIAGKYVNHSASPNCKYEQIGDDIWLVAIKPICGANGGGSGGELTADYRQAVKTSKEYSK